ncbi:MAG: hypothetical protein AAB798_00135 [Patescibacteria group bacterium]
MHQVSTAKLIEILVVLVIVSGFIFAVTSSREPEQLPYVNVNNFDECVIGGCNSELCGEKALMDQVVSTCEYRAEYACYEYSACERQIDEKCGWTQTPELESCLANPREQDAGLEEVF